MLILLRYNGFLDWKDFRFDFAKKIGTLPALFLLVLKKKSPMEVEDSALEKIAKVFGVMADAIKNFSEEAVFNIIGNTFTDSSSNNNNYFCTINPIEKIIELYERLLASEREKVELLKNK